MWPRPCRRQALILPPSGYGQIYRNRHTSYRHTLTNLPWSSVAATELGEATYPFHRELFPGIVRYKSEDTTLNSASTITGSDHA